MSNHNLTDEVPAMPADGGEPCSAFASLFDRLTRLGLYVLLICSAFALFFFVINCSRKPKQVLPHPETGYKFPALSDIETMQMTAWSDGAASWFTVPKDAWNAMLDSLSPSEAVVGPPPCWGVRAFLKIEDKQGRRYEITLFETEEPLGAFSVAEGTGHPTYYRCENAAKLRRSIDDIHTQHAGRGGKKTADGH